MPEKKRVVYTKATSGCLCLLARIYGYSKSVSVTDWQRVVLKVRFRLADSVRLFKPPPSDQADSATRTLPLGLPDVNGTWRPEAMDLYSKAIEMREWIPETCSIL